MGRDVKLARTDEECINFCQTIIHIHAKKQQQNLTKHNPLRREATDGDPVDWLFDLDFFLSIQLKLELLDRQKAPVINK